MYAEQHALIKQTVLFAWQHVTFKRVHVFYTSQQSSSVSQPRAEIRLVSSAPRSSEANKSDAFCGSQRRPSGQLASAQAQPLTGRNKTCTAETGSHTVGEICVSAPCKVGLEKTTTPTKNICKTEAVRDLDSTLCFLFLKKGIYGNVNHCRRHGKQYRGSSKNYRWNYHMIHKSHSCVHTGRT